MIQGYADEITAYIVNIFRVGKCGRRAAFLFSEIVPTFVTKFNKTGNICRAHLLLRWAAEQMKMSHETVRKALIIDKFHLHKMHMIHELHDDDYEQQIENWWKLKTAVSSIGKTRSQND